MSACEDCQAPVQTARISGQKEKELFEQSPDGEFRLFKLDTGWGAVKETGDNLANYRTTGFPLYRRHHCGLAVAQVAEPARYVETIEPMEPMPLVRPETTSAVEWITPLQAARWQEGRGDHVRRIRKHKVD